MAFETSTSRHWALLVAVTSVLLSASAVAEQPVLPPDVQADVLQTKMVQSALANDSRGIIAAADQFDSQKLPMPPDLRFLEAKAAAQVSDDVRAFTALRVYLAGADKSKPKYKEALSLYSGYESKAEEAEKRQDFERHAAAKRAQDAKQQDALVKVQVVIHELAESMVNIPAGRFEMGSVNSRDKTARPVHTVTIKTFRIGKVPVLETQYAAFEAMKNAHRRYINEMGGTAYGSVPPTLCVSWNDAEAFIVWINKSGGTHYRLPTESEWEYVERAGVSFKTIFAWGNDLEGVRGWDRYAPNAFGVYGMSSGNPELVQDFYHETFYRAPSDGSAWLIGGSGQRVIRGANRVLAGRNPVSPDDTGRSESIWAQTFRLAEDVP